MMAQPAIRWVCLPLSIMVSALAGPHSPAGGGVGLLGGNADDRIFTVELSYTVQRPEPGVSRLRASLTPGLLLFVMRRKTLVA